MENKVKAEELRLANYIAIGKKKEPIYILSLRFDLNEGYLVNDIPVEHFQGIELTPEILEKCPQFAKQIFVDKTSAYDCKPEDKEFTIRIYIDKEGAFLHLTFDGGYYPEIKKLESLHDLQNAFYILTSTELKINM